jgi:S1-C subfamily serine protease
MNNINREHLKKLNAIEEKRFLDIHPKSGALFEKAKGVMPGGVPMSWMAKWPGAYPIFVESAAGSHFTDVDGNKYIAATFINSDPTIDSGVVRLEYSPTDIPPLKFGNSDAVEVGDIVAVISAPEGLHDTATVGRVSNLHQSINDPNMPAWNDVIFVDADILEGSSGGMVIGTDNLVVGTIMGVTGQHADIGIGQNSISPSNKIIELLKEL